MFPRDNDQHRAMLAAIIESSEDAIISKDMNGFITSWNMSAQRVFGYTAEEIIGLHVTTLIPKDRLNEEDLIMSALRSGKRIEHYRTIRMRKDGSEVHISLTVSPIRNYEGVVIGASKIARDIGMQVEMDERLQQYATQLETINNVSKMINAKLNVNDILQNVTDATTRLCGASFGAFFYNKVDVSGETYLLYALSGAPKEAFEKFGMPRNTEVFDVTFSGKGIFRSDDITKDPRYGHNSPHHGMPKGHLPVVSYLAVPVTSPSGIVIGGLFYGHPSPGVFKLEHENLVVAIAAQAAVALDNAKLYEEVQALSSKKDQFIGFTSHELKTPLTTVKGYIQLAQRAPETVSLLLPKISKQVNRLSAIINDLLDVSKIQAGRLEFHFALTSVFALIRDSLDTISHFTDGHKIETQLMKQDLSIYVDAHKMTQVIVNVLSNAIKYSPQGSVIVLTVQLLGDQLQISVKDQGVGIRKDLLKEIFSQFYRINVAHKDGMGLGLYISKEIIDGHHGQIWAESDGSNGSTFHINVPIGKLPD